MVSELVERIDVVENPAARGISWRAILGGAFVMAAVAFILTVLGAGLGLSSISPWPDSGATATQFAVMSGVWLIIVQWVSAGIGGYMAGRLGPESSAYHLHEIHFRDTARGIVAWSVAAVITIAVLTTAASSLVGGTVRGAANLVAAAGQGATQGAAQQGMAQSGTQNAGDAARPSGYLVDTLFRKATPDANTSAQDARGEATRIIVTGLRNGDLSPADRTYLAQLVAARTGLSQDEAQKRVDDVVAQAKQAEQKAREAADAARKTARDVAFFTAFSMLIGAFIAGVAGKLGGHHRDALL